MDPTVVSYLLYVLLSVGLTVWVARTLARAGRRFLVDVFDGDRELADSVNHLLVVGFYLVNLGYVLLALRSGGSVEGLRTGIEELSRKVGFVLVVLGALHFLNLFVLGSLRRGKRLRASS